MMRIQLVRLRHTIRPLTSSTYRPRRFLSTTHFGYETVDEKEKQKKVNHVFENVAQKYDLMNDVMSFGIHRLWKDCFINHIMPTDNLKCLDVAGGTGDIAFRICKISKPIPNSNQSDVNHDNGHNDHTMLYRSGPEITVCDINPSMIEVGQSRAKELGISTIQWVEGNAEQLPFKDDSFDLYTIAFGIRNCTHLDKVLSEAYRVLKPFGRFYCLEFSHVQNPIFRRIYDTYSMQMIPVMGQLIAGDWNSYQYLVESIRQFPTQEEFGQMIQKAGFDHPNWINYSNGIVAVHSGFKLPPRTKTKLPDSDTD